MQICATVRVTLGNGVRETVRRCFPGKCVAEKVAQKWYTAPVEIRIFFGMRYKMTRRPK